METKKHMEELENSVQQMEDLQNKADQSICEVSNEKDAQIEKYASQIQHLTQVNEELRQLFDQERQETLNDR